MAPRTLQTCRLQRRGRLDPPLPCARRPDTSLPRSRGPDSPMPRRPVAWSPHYPHGFPSSAVRRPDPLIHMPGVRITPVEPSRRLIVSLSPSCVKITTCCLVARRVPVRRPRVALRSAEFFPADIKPVVRRSDPPHQPFCSA